MEQTINTPITLLTAISKYYNLTPDEVISTSRRSDLVMIRQLYLYIGHTFYKYNKIALSRCLKQDHTSGLHSVKKIQGYIDVKDQKVINEVDNILIELKFKSHKKWGYEKKYDNLLAQFLQLKSDYKKLQNTVQFLNRIVA